jgi:hypothetical protein
VIPFRSRLSVYQLGEDGDMQAKSALLLAVIYMMDHCPDSRIYKGPGGCVSCGAPYIKGPNCPWTIMTAWPEGAVEIEPRAWSVCPTCEERRGIVDVIKSCVGPAACGEDDVEVTVEWHG